MTITEFLLARIQEDETATRNFMSRDNTNGTIWGRVLAECAAKRAIVEPFAKEWARPERLTDAYLSATLKLLLRSVIAPLAAVYKDHPDYRREWKP